MAKPEPITINDLFQMHRYFSGLSAQSSLSPKMQQAKDKIEESIHHVIMGIKNETDQPNPNDDIPF